MSEFFFEAPWMVGAVGLVISLLAGFIWTQTAHPAALYSTIGAAVVSLLLVMVNLQVVTDAERIRGIMDDVARDLQNNDRQRVYSYLHPNAVAGLKRAQAELPKYEFVEARITRVKSIDINLESSPPTAISEFNVFVKVKAHGQTFRVPRFVKVYWMLRDEEWMVRDYEHYDPTMGFRNDRFNSLN